VRKDVRALGLRKQLGSSSPEIVRNTKHGSAVKGMEISNKSEYALNDASF
jgi:hypothetical protein